MPTKELSLLLDSDTFNQVNKIANTKKKSKKMAITNDVTEKVE